MKKMKISLALHFHGHVGLPRASRGVPRPRDEPGEGSRAGPGAAAGSPSLRCRAVTAKRAAQRRRRALKPSDGVARRATARAPWSPTTRAGAGAAARWATHRPTAVHGHTRVHTLPRLERRSGTHDSRLSPPPLHVARSPSGPCRGIPSFTCPQETVAWRSVPPQWARANRSKRQGQTSG